MSIRTNKIRFARAVSGSIVEEQELLKRIERLQIKKQIQQFASFLPDEILRLRGSAKQMAMHRHFVGVLLYMDVSGILQLIERHYNGNMSDLYTMTVELNAYFGAIIQVIFAYGGDVLGIFSTTFVSLWKYLPDNPMHDILHTVIICASVLQRFLGEYNTHVQVPLNLKTIITCGNLSYSIFGNDTMKKAIYLGDAFKSLIDIMACADLNQVVISATTYPHILKDRYTVVESQKGYVMITKVTYTSRETSKKAYFDEKYLEASGMIREHLKQRDAFLDLLKSSRLLANIKMHAKFIKSLPPRGELLSAAQHWTVHDMQPLQNEVIFEQLSDCQPGDFLTEIREVTCLHMKIIANVIDTNTMMVVVSDLFTNLANEIKNMECIVQHIYVLDNDIMIRILFGLTVRKRENDAAIALTFARRMKLQFEECNYVIDVSAGVSGGNAYCSVIGHPLRREYAIIGHPIVKARRLASMVTDKVLCDLKAFKSARLSSLYFKIFKTEDCPNGETDAILEYNEAFETTGEFVDNCPLVDRVADFNLTLAMVRNPLVMGFRGICFSATKKLGKSKLLSSLHEEFRSHDCITSFVTMIEMLKRPFYCISDIYRQIYDQVYTIHVDINSILDLPRDLTSFVDADDPNENLALQKYRILNYFRDLLKYVKDTVIIFIDDVQHIDEQSWEIIEMTFPMNIMRLVMSYTPSKVRWTLLHRIEENDQIKIKELLPLKDRHMAEIICILLKAEALSYNLLCLLNETCGGSPGYLEFLLLRLVNNKTITLKLAYPNAIDSKEYYYLDVEKVKRMKILYPIVHFSPENAMLMANLTMYGIYEEFFDSIPKFLQFVIKTAALIGMQFGRQLLRLALNLPAERDLAKAIKILFEEQVFQCASLISSQNRHTSKLCCGCCFDKNAVFIDDIPKYAHCKLMQFRTQDLRDVAYERLAENQRHELHVLCAEVLEKMIHICPSCMRNPSNYYSFFGDYDSFLEFCQNPKTLPNYFQYAKDCYESIKYIINKHAEAHKIEVDENAVKNRDQIIIDEKYIPLMRHYDPSACYCLEMRHVLYKDIIYHSQQANDTGKMIFYKLKFGLIQMCMLDVAGAMETFHDTRELSLVNCGLKEDQFDAVFRKYHVGKASVGLALCNLKIKNIPAAKSNIMLALRQYHVPLLAFTFKQFRFLLRRGHLRAKTLKYFGKKKDVYGWEIGSALCICAKIYALENNWDIARDCCKCGISLLKANNTNLAVLLDTYSDALKIYSISKDNRSCLRLQTYLVQELQSYYAQSDVFSFHMLLDLLNIVLELHIVRGHLRDSISLGYRFLNLADQSKVLKINPSVLLTLCELTMYNLSFTNFNDLMVMLIRHLSPYHQHNSLYYYLMCMHFYNYTGFHVREFDEVLNFARQYFLNHTGKMSPSEMALKMLIHVHYLRCHRYGMAMTWDVNVDFSKSVRSSSKVVKLMLFHMEASLYKLIRSSRRNDEMMEEYWMVQIRELSTLLKDGVKQNIMYRAAYYGLNAWFFILTGKRRKAFTELDRMYKVADKQNNLYFKAFALRLQNYWDGGFILPYESRPHVSSLEAPRYSFEQFAQFLHAYILH